MDARRFDPSPEVPCVRPVPAPKEPNAIAAGYLALAAQVHEAGLLRRRRGYYITLFTLLMLALAGAWTGFALLGASWFQLLIAAVLGILFTQFSFLAHEAAHRQVFASKRVNEWAARLIGTGLVGISYAMWVRKHTRHHGFPNQVDRDPDIHTGAVAFHPDAAAARRGLMMPVTRCQGYLLFPLLLFLGFSLHVDSVKYLLRPAAVDHRWFEIPLLAARFTLLVGAVFFFLPAGLALAFIGVQVAVFGFYMGASFSPNHKGMPIYPKSARPDFVTRQVTASRNIRGGIIMDLLMGGLNRQTEHHLFPDMPRPSLHKAAAMVRRYCRTHNIPYTETGLISSYATIVRYLNGVGIAATDPFHCPVADIYRPD
ncbi:fatty acid desaturase [Arthrobacter sp. Marseille-P9274]|uniref:fatty acid desaturase family protein n=1 Tax=Arthrobacter sp. Marseille-P9274 TaxID=2866572 RepID=UPI0021CA685C|nr:fatty acid desaturase [Arthrobacter sp. Marseille-P9274]